MTNYLEDLLPPRWRKRVYALLGLLAMLAGTIQAVLLSTGTPTPTWLTVTLTVILYLTAGGSGMARDNTPSSEGGGSDPSVEPPGLGGLPPSFTDRPPGHLTP